MPRSKLHMGPRLATGSLADIHEVTIDGRRVVLKALSEQAATDQGAITRLSREGKVTAELAHPNIRALIHQADRCLVLEHVDLSVADVLRAGGSLPVDAAVYIVGELLRALDYLHRRGRIHRDVTTANILVTMDGTIKLADFETCKELGAPQTTGVLMRGTLGYMSPEQLNSADIDERSDIFSAGVVLYELLTGMMPFGRTRETMLRGLYGPGPPRPTQDHRPELEQRQQLLAALDRMLERGRTARCPSAALALEAMPRIRQGRAELVARLAELAAEGAFGECSFATDPTDSNPTTLDTTTTTTARRTASRHRRLAACLVVVLVGAAVAWFQLSPVTETGDVRPVQPVESLRARQQRQIDRHYTRRISPYPSPSTMTGPDAVTRHYHFSELLQPAPAERDGAE